MKVLIRITDGSTKQLMAESWSDVDDTGRMLVNVVWTPEGLGNGNLHVDVRPIAAEPAPSKPNLKIVKDE